MGDAFFPIDTMPLAQATMNIGRAGLFEMGNALLENNNAILGDNRNIVCQRFQELEPDARIIWGSLTANAFKIPAGISKLRISVSARLVVDQLQGPWIYFKSQFGSWVTAGTITGGTSGATATTISGPDTGGFAAGKGRLLVTMGSGTFLQGETITCTSGGTATIDTLVNAPDAFYSINARVFTLSKDTSLTVDGLTNTDPAFTSLLVDWDPTLPVQDCYIYITVQGASPSASLTDPPSNLATLYRVAMDGVDVAIEEWGL